MELEKAEYCCSFNSRGRIYCDDAYGQTSSVDSLTVASIFKVRRTQLTNSYYSTSTIFSDNEAAISILHHPEFHPRTKHININYHFLWNLVESTIIDVVYIKTDRNLADIFTKGLPKAAHKNFSYELGLLPDQEECWDNPVVSQHPEMRMRRDPSQFITPDIEKMII